MGFDLNSAISEGIDKAQDAINEKAGQEVISEENAEKAKGLAADAASKLTEKFGK